MRHRALLATLALLVAGCGSDAKENAATSATAPVDTGSTADRPLPRDGDRVRLDPSDFTTRIDNRHFPMAPGTRWVYREMGENGREQRDVVTVTNQVKVVDGVRARVVHDVETQGGVRLEDTFDWYAQDGAGNVWYLGESTREYEHGKVATTEGSWEAGVDGAQAGVIMPARPVVGLGYRQEQYRGHAEDRAEVVGIDQHAVVPFGRFSHVLVTEDTNALARDVEEHKYYASGVGPVLTVSMGGRREELMRFDRPRG
jgi:hypothetical protein